MENKHIIIGTAGHVDHGKTALIKALTNFDCDTHKQEKERGITINQGFTHVDLPNGNSLGIIDVPGHADFIKNMIAGACGIDLVMLVIAADEGIMPQTSEHLAILELLGIKNGIIILNKVDLVDQELLELAEEEVSEFVAGTFLEHSEIIKFSAITGAGKPKLLESLMSASDKTEPKKTDGIFRMYIDRVFVKEGFGTILNGSVLSGKINKNDSVFLLPNKKELRMRKLQRHGKDVDDVLAGDRASLNVVGFKSKDFKRGMLLSNEMLQDTKLLDVQLTLFEESPILNLWNQVLFLHETLRVPVRVHLLDEDILQSGKSCLAQVYLPFSIIAEIGDKFIIRNSSGNVTLGGGEIIDNHPLHHRRRRKGQIEEVQKIAFGETAELIAAQVRKSLLPLSHKQIAKNINLPADELIEIIFSELPGDVIFYQNKEDVILFMKKYDTKYKNRVLTGLQEYHKKNPLKKKGRTFNELCGVFGELINEGTKTLLKLILNSLEENRKLKKAENTWVLFDHSVELSENLKKDIKSVGNFIKESKVILNNPVDVSAEFPGINDKQMKSILNFLTDSGEIILHSESFICKAKFEEYKNKLTKFLKSNKAGITIADFRDLLETNRSTAMTVISLFDDMSITVRKGNFRVLTKKYLELIK